MINENIHNHFSYFIQIFFLHMYILFLKGGVYMYKKEDHEKTTDNYTNKEKPEIPKTSIEPLPESTRPRQDGPGGN
jgi:hypothetical protein